MKTNETSRNRSVRCPVKSSDFQDISVIGASIEKNNPFAKPFCAKDYAYYTMNYIINGYGWATYAGKTVRLCPDMLYVVYPNSEATIVQDEKQPYTLAWMNLDGAKVKKIMQRIGIAPDRLTIQLERDDRLRNCFKQAPSQCKNDIEKSDLISLKYFYDIIFLILKQTAKNSPPPPATF